MSKKIVTTDDRVFLLNLTNMNSYKFNPLLDEYVKNRGWQPIIFPLTKHSVSWVQSELRRRQVIAQFWLADNSKLSELRAADKTQLASEYPGFIVIFDSTSTGARKLANYLARVLAGQPLPSFPDRPIIIELVGPETPRAFLAKTDSGHWQLSSQPFVLPTYRTAQPINERFRSFLVDFARAWLKDEHSFNHRLDVNLEAHKEIVARGTVIDDNPISLSCPMATIFQEAFASL